MNTRPFLLHALSPLHAGTGHSAGIIDLPTARMKGTGIPFLPGSSIKGVLRDSCQGGGDRVEAAFGPSDDSGLHAGALVVGDARLVALPVRTFKGAFAWVSSPLLLALTKRDLGAEHKLEIPSLSERGALVTKSTLNTCVQGGRLYLEDLDLVASTDPRVDVWAEFLAKLVSPESDVFSKRFAIIDDDTMTFLCETATQVDARVAIDRETGTARAGALWLEESLPPETILIGLMGADRSRREGVPMEPTEVLDFVLEQEEVLQFGGKATIGRGRCRILPIRSADKGGPRAQR
ncbi:MAG: type III-B CRISPR module RAMP protein Cmr4 [Bradymonadaceae bacterium]|nr:type III-B CRISPR module RAMP protein Cmr4 [Lujinxingiaceae bacterium]